jgi:hypothetical protein
MKRLLGASVLFVVAACFPLRASEVISIPPCFSPSVSISVDGVPVGTGGLTITCDPSTGLGSIVGVIETTAFSLSVIDTTTSPDPFEIYAFGATNLTTAPETISYSISTPVLGGPYDTISNSFKGSMTDGAGDGVSLTGIVQMALLNTLNVPAVALGPSTCTGGPSGVPLTSYPCPAGPGFGPVSAMVTPSFYTSLGMDLTFTLSPGDSAAFSGGVDLTASPEPTTAALIGLSLLCLAGFRARSRRP